MEVGEKANEVMPNLVKYCDVLFDGANETGKVLGIDYNENDTQETIFSSWMKTFPKLKNIVTTQRIQANASSNGISDSFWDGKEMLQSRKYKVSHIIDRIGAGDGFMARIIYGLLTYKEHYQTVLEFAVAASCLKHSISGDINLATVKEVEALMLGFGEEKFQDKIN